MPLLLMSWIYGRQCPLHADFWCTCCEQAQAGRQHSLQFVYTEFYLVTACCSWKPLGTAIG